MFDHQDTLVRQSAEKTINPLISVRRKEYITGALRVAKVSSGPVSEESNQKIYGKIEEWRMNPTKEEHPRIFPAGVYLKRSW